MDYFRADGESIFCRGVFRCVGCGLVVEGDIIFIWFCSGGLLRERRGLVFGLGFRIILEVWEGFIVVFLGFFFGIFDLDFFVVKYYLVLSRY